MQIIIKKLQGGELSIMVEDSTKVIDIKRNIALKHKISVCSQKLLYMGRALADEQPISSYPSIKDGTKLHLLVRKAEGLLEGSAKFFREKGMPDDQAKSTAKRLVQITEEKFNKMSWDDIERLATDILMYETGDYRPLSESEGECEDSLGL
ncbi:unnamed protein product [Leptosia nina]|uniref:Ubiquitin-like domain-containing protein n=1 Tax=Leptosia nina TaxID=320188 RepID=A0AAV1JW03_9NEOP